MENRIQVDQSQEEIELRRVTAESGDSAKFALR
jgi:hypothetical protein